MTTRKTFERETIVVMDDLGKDAEVFTFSEPLIRKLRNYAVERPDECKIVKEYESGAYTFEVPKKWVKVSPPRKVSDEQREAAAARLKAYREEKNVCQRD